MTRPLVAVLFAALTAPAMAAPQSSMKPPANPIFEIDKLDTRADAPQQKVQLWSDGAWSFYETVKGASTRNSTGKLDADQLKQARADLAAATWKTTSVIHCMMATTSSTAFKVDGKVVFTAHACNGVKLDDASSKALDDLQQLLASAWPKDAASPGSAAKP